ncbi:hypothetical protein NPIL_107461 [Nephila pilipes]|uniref:Uncharacterized protein n=1 Tax=Nephila pilipes TaxID=299642 RepID=A0A8X6U6L3_NEPPI|nr:hypothetical protein NPIL_107461 [Nephila pilipes]
MVLLTHFNSYLISLSCDDSIIYPHASSSDNANVITFAFHSTYNDGPQIRRSAKRWHPTRALDSSKNENRSSGSGCLLSSLSASVPCCITKIGDTPIRLRSRFTISGIKPTVSTTTVAAPRKGSTDFERTSVLLK